jgi:heterodisulfide reductase subunit D
MIDLTHIIRDTGIRLCLDCGKCTVVCPVAKYDNGFNPRLIVQNALRLNNGDAVDPTIWSCLSCNLCMERCNYNVKYTDFIRALRYKALQEGAQLEYNHGGIMQTIMHINSNGSAKGNEFSWLPSDVQVNEQSDTVFFIGCAPYFDIVFNDLETHVVDGTIGALRLLNRVQTPFKLLRNERCCGRDLLLIGDLQGFLNLAKANASEVSKRNIKKIITSCPECYYTLKVDYPKFVENWDIEVIHITEVLAPLITGSQLKLGRLEKKITYHDPCTLGRYSRIFEQPRVLLSTVDGLQLAEMSDNRERSLCCGASPWVYCSSINKQIQKERLGQAVATGAEMLITACPKCQIHLKCAQKEQNSDNVTKIEIQDMCSFVSKLLLP